MVFMNLDPNRHIHNILGINLYKLAGKKMNFNFNMNLYPDRHIDKKNTR